MTELYQQRIHQQTRVEVLKKVNEVNEIRLAQGKKKMTAPELIAFAVKSVNINKAAKG